ncbi:class IV adenylate cyclase [Halococcus saccharolyticus]|uniref:Adenylyl cyclase CyaB n=1 Tax=Halococcus saccharolyticus DSM 5350 TaxID=1227455 RepID=M0MKY4_9EURY|nr:class IV adenylate cyclase [Halococcus saccharolyticus]EMA45090.1 adenylyl cyclase CyaB [Halococcus saccharolyticus DSM 5350]
MYEVELKVRAAHEPVRDALVAREATRLGTVAQDDTYYDAPHRSFVETDEALRLRHETQEENAESTTHLTYKGPLVDTTSKTREEAETAVDDPEAAETIVEALGFSPAASVRKRRERFALGEYTIALDSVTDVGQFVEVERTVETETEIDRARDGARELLADLGLDPDDQLRTSYLALLLDARETADEQNERDGGNNRQ